MGLESPAHRQAPKPALREERIWLPRRALFDKVAVKQMSDANDFSASDSRSLGHNPFSTLSSEGLPPGPSNAAAQPKPVRKNRGRVDILRQKAGRGGKTVTVVKGFVGIGLPEKEQLAKTMQKRCGTGGTVKDGQIEIQGDKREEIARILTEAGFRPVFAGG
jgi:translation initiation factor 1